MLLSPIGSPSKYQAHFCRPLPPLAHDVHDIHDTDTDTDADALDADTECLALPPELICDIVEVASIHRRTAVSLCLVSSWIRAIVIQCMYKTVVIHAGSTVSPFTYDAPCDDDGGLAVRVLPSPLRHIRSLWLEVPPECAPRSLESCTQLTQLALPLEASETICRSQRWRDPHKPDVTPCRSFTVLGQSHPQRWVPLTQTDEGLSFLRGLTHLRLLNLCLSHYIPLEYTPNLTHLCLPFFDLRMAESASNFTGLDYILAQPHLQMVVLTLNPRYWRFEELSLKGWALRAKARDERLYVLAATRDDATRDWESPRRDWEDEAAGAMSVWDKAIQVRQKFMARLSRNCDS